MQVIPHGYKSYSLVVITMIIVTVLQCFGKFDMVMSSFLLAALGLYYGKAYSNRIIDKNTEQEQISEIKN